MMGTPEFDFFDIEKQINEKPDLEKSLQSLRNAQGIQRTISKIEPLMLKNIIASRAVPENFAGKSPENSPFSGKMARSVSENHLQGTAPLTIFYNGRVHVFYVLPDKAEKIIKLAASGNYSFIESTSQLNESVPPSPSFQRCGSQLLLLRNLNADLPIARKMSLQRFLERRKERLTSVDPYANMMGHGDKNIMGLAKA